MRSLILTLVLLISLTSYSYAQTCDGALTVTVLGSTTGDVLSAAETHIDLSCNAGSGSPDGSIDVVPDGGTTPYTFDWADIVGTDDGEDRTGLTAGTYSVIITDANGCTTDLGPIVLAEPNAVTVTGTQTDLACNSGSGSADGAITITPGGGTVAGNYTFAWTTSDGSGLVAADQDQTGLSAGTYTVVISDDNSCTATTSFTLTEPTAVTVTGTQADLSCNSVSGSADGTITITPGGGTVAGNYTFAWTTSDGSGLVAADQDQTGLSAGTYTVVVSDDNSCTASTSFTLTEPTAVACTATSPTLGTGNTNILCDGGTGSIVAEGSGGTAPYTYSINGTDFQASGTFTNVAAGAYTVTTMDDNGCTSTCTVTLTEPTPLAAGSCNYVQDLCQLGDGEIKIEASGGVAPYSVSWSATPVAPNTTAGDLDQASPQTIATDGGSVTFTGADGNNQYNFIVTDANGCVIP